MTGQGDTAEAQASDASTQSAGKHIASGAAEGPSQEGYRAVWDAVTGIVLRREDRSQIRRAWLRLTSLRAIVDDTAVLEVPDAYVAWQVETVVAIINH